jgi:3-hydroxyacyl-CoA dehydrogenase
MSDIVTYSVQGHLGVITLNNPPVNALSQSKGVLQRIMDAIKEGEHDQAVKAFLVLGSGRAFSGGADISEFADTFATAESTALFEEWRKKGFVPQTRSTLYGPGTDVCSVDDGGGFILRCP